MNIYENIIILNASLPDEEINTAIGRIKDIIIKSDGEVLKTDAWGRKKLGYEIKKHTKGHFTLLIYKAPASTIKKLEEFFKVFDPVIKFMIIRLGPKQIKHLETVQTESTEQTKSEE